MSTLKSINVQHPSATTINIVNDSSGNVSFGGNVGIGTVSPLDLLSLSSTSGAKLRINSTVSTTNAQQIYNVAYNQTRSSDTDYGSGGTLFVGVSENGVTGASSNMWSSSSGYVGASFIGFSGYSTASTYVGDIRFFTKYNNVTAERMRIDSSGNVGIGTSSPLGRFQVVGSAISNPVESIFSTASGDTAYQATLISKYDNNTTTSQVFIRFAVNNNGATSGQINANGANSAAFGTWSDERLKDNIVNLPSQLANICALRPVEFDYKDGSGHQIGFVAQEMKTVYPDAVGTGTDDMLTITGWSKTEARLVAAIQELSAKNDALEARLAALESK